MTATLTSDAERLLYTIPQVTQVTGIPRTRVFAEMAAGRLPRVKLGRATFVKRTDLEAFVAGL